MAHATTLLRALAVLLLGLAAFAAPQSEPLARARARWQALAPAERQRLEERWQRFQSLPEDEQRELRARAARIQDLRERTERSLPAPLRARVQQLPETKRERILTELVENETARIGARVRALLPPEVVQRLEQARPEDRARYFANYQRQQQKRVTSYMIERLGQRLGLAPDEISAMKSLPEEQRGARVLALRQRLSGTEAREFGLPPGLSQEQWEIWLRLPPEDFFERLADFVRERQLAGAEAGIRSGGSRPVEPAQRDLARFRALRLLQQASEADPADLVELADEAPEARAAQVEERTRQRCLRLLREERLGSAEELEHWKSMNAAALAGVVHELLAPLRARWRPPAEAPR